MNEFSKTGPSSGSLHQEVAALRTMISLILVFMIVVSGCALGTLWLQKRRLNREIEEAQRTIAGYEKVSGNIYFTFASSLQSFAKTHPDLNPILEKYGIAESQTGPTQPAAPAPAPRAVNPPKK